MQRFERRGWVLDRRWKLDQGLIKKIRRTVEAQRSLRKQVLLFTKSREIEHRPAGASQGPSAVAWPFQVSNNVFQCSLTPSRTP